VHRACCTLACRTARHLLGQHTMCCGARPRVSPPGAHVQRPFHRPDQREGSQRLCGRELIFVAQDKIGIKVRPGRPNQDEKICFRSLGLRSGVLNSPQLCQPLVGSVLLAGDVWPGDGWARVVTLSASARLFARTGPIKCPTDHLALSHLRCTYKAA
jgi:hypothetical protein